MTFKELAKELTRFSRVWISGVSGDTVYISGSTFPIREELVKLGGRFNRVKGCWEFKDIKEIDKFIR